MTYQISATSRLLEECPAVLTRNKAAHSDPREDIVRQLQPMRAFALFLAGDRAQADDLVESTMVKAWATIGKREPGSNVRAWLYTILRNSFYSECRTKAGEIDGDAGARDAQMSAEPSPDDIHEPADFFRAFNTLPAVQREALVLVGPAGFSFDEAATICRCTIGTIEARRDLALQRLSRLFPVEQGDALGQAGFRP